MSTPDLSPVGEVQAPPVERFRKRAIEVEMMLWDGSDERLLALERWCGNLRDDPTASPRFIVDADRNGAVFNDQERDWIKCPLGHRVAMGALGEFYPVSPAAIAGTFDPAPEPLELTPEEQAAKEKSEHMSTCHEEACVDCMRELRVIRRIVKAIRPHIAEEQAKTVDRLRAALERVAEELEEEGHTAQLDSAFRIREALAPVAAASDPTLTPDGGLVDVRD